MIVSRGQPRADGQPFGCSLGSLPAITAGPACAVPALPRERDSAGIHGACAFHRKPFPARAQAGKVTLE